MIIFLAIFGVLGLLGFGFWTRVFGGVIGSSMLSDSKSSDESSDCNDSDCYDEGWTHDD